MCYCRLKKNTNRFIGQMASPSNKLVFELDSPNWSIILVSEQQVDQCLGSRLGVGVGGFIAKWTLPPTRLVFFV